MAGEPQGRIPLVVEELLERGDPAFVDELRRCHDADALGTFAARLYADRRPASRRLMLAYLDRPLNAYRHEVFVKRLFKFAETAGDDEAMARFLVLFDRSIRRKRQTIRRHRSELVDGREAAEALAELWRSQGLRNVTVWENWRNRFHVGGSWTEDRLITPGTLTMPRGTRVRRWGQDIPDWTFCLDLYPVEAAKLKSLDETHVKKLERFRLFTPETRRYLRRRAWRYFRRLGRREPDRYVPAIVGALTRYRDEDAIDGLALLDNWGLVHALFHFSPALESHRLGWLPAEGHSLAELEPAPMFAPLWARNPRVLVDLLTGAACRAVRLWAIRMIRRFPDAIAEIVGLEEWLGLLANEDAEVVGLAAEMLRTAPGLEAVPAARWLALVEGAQPAAMDILVELIGGYLAADRVDFADAARLAASRPLPLARLGLGWLRAKRPVSEGEYAIVRELADAECVPLRPEIVAWARGVLATAPGFQPDWVVAFLDSRHDDVRAEGLRWLRAEPRAGDDAEVWRKLLESPYDDVRFALVRDLEARVEGGGVAANDALDPEALRFLWASVLLNVHRGSRAKGAVVRLIRERVERRPGEASALLPLLAVALRSARGPEWKSGLAALVRLSERDAATAELVRAEFPRLQLA